jgi:hypothetical protein
MSNAKIWATRCNCNHGDLNATNIAIDPAPATPQAYIFDAAGVQSDFRLRDLATLEVTTILFNSPFMDGQFEACKVAYAESFLPEDGSARSSGLVENILGLVRALRSRVESKDRLRCVSPPDIWPRRTAVAEQGSLSRARLRPSQLDS